MTRDEWLAEQERLGRGYAAARAQLLEIPGVVEVGIGIRHRGGELVEEPVYVVHVTTKRPPAEVAPDGLIPAEIEGVATDVEQHRGHDILWSSHRGTYQWANWRGRYGGNERQEPR